MTSVTFSIFIHHEMSYTALVKPGIDIGHTLNPQIVNIAAYLGRNNGFAIINRFVQITVRVSSHLRVVETEESSLPLLLPTYREYLNIAADSSILLHYCPAAFNRSFYFGPVKSSVLLTSYISSNIRNDDFCPPSVLLPSGTLKSRFCPSCPGF